MKLPHVGLVTCKNLPEPDTDQDLLLSALRDGGFIAEMIAWDDRSADPEAFDICVIRSPWNYHLMPDEFLGWLGRADSATLLMNPAEIVRGNIHKKYLRGLEAAGVPVIPTVFIDRGEPADLKAIMRAQGWDDVVVKPAVSASSYRTRRFHNESAAGAKFLEALSRDRDAMVQQYMPAVETTGERAVVWIAGEITHAIRKSPRYHDGEERVSAAVPISERERAAALAALDAGLASPASLAAPPPSPAAGVAEKDLLYARIDLIESPTGAVLVSELELIEPSLFLLQNPAAASKLCSAIRALLPG